MNIGNIVLSVTKSSSKAGYWTVRVQYEAYFAQAELAAANCTDWFELWEKDDWSADDKILVSASKSFKPTTTTVKRELTAESSESALDTEVGTERLYVIVYLYNSDGRSQVSATSKVLELSV